MSRTRFQAAPTRDIGWTSVGKWFIPYVHLPGIPATPILPAPQAPTQAKMECYGARMFPVYGFTMRISAFCLIHAAAVAWLAALLVNPCCL